MGDDRENKGGPPTIRIDPDMAEMVGNLLSTLGTFISTIGFATDLKRQEAQKKRDLEDARKRLARLEAELDELKEMLGHGDDPVAKRRP